MVFRVEKNDNFTVMSNVHLRDKSLSLKAKGLLSWMLSNANDWDYTLNGIVASCKESETAVTSALNELKDHGYLTVTKENSSESGRFEYIYNIYETPINTEKSPQGDFPPLGFPPLGNPALENEAQRNTNTINTNKRKTNKRKIPGNISSDILEIAKSTQVDADSNTSDYESHMYTDDLKKKKKSDSEKSSGKKLSLWDKCVMASEEFTDDKELLIALEDYLKVRLRMKDKQLYNVTQWKGLLGKLKSLQGDPVKIVRQSTELGYASFWELKTSGNSYNSKPTVETFGEHQGMHSTKLSKEEREDILNNGKVF